MFDLLEKFLEKKVIMKLFFVEYVKNRNIVYYLVGL